MVLRYAHRLTFPTVHSKPIRCLAFHPNRDVVASAGEDTKVIMWDTNSGEVKYYAEGRSPARSLLWTSWDEELHCGFQDGYLMSVTADEADQMLRVKGVLCHASLPLESMTAHPDGRILATAARAEVRLWTRKSKRVTLGEEGHWKAYAALREPQKTAVTEKHEVIVTSVHWLPPNAFKSFGSDTNPTASFSDVGDVLVSYLTHGVVCWDVNSCSARWYVSMSGYVSTTALSSSAQYLAVSDFRGGVDIYDMDTGFIVKSFIISSRKERSPVSFIHDDTSLLASNSNGVASIWHVFTGTEVQCLRLDAHVTQLANAPAIAAQTLSGDLLRVAVGLRGDGLCGFSIWETVEVEVEVDRR
ncbi:WD40 repeat-like protein [Coniophora puteana RWD-64-598 SS2]|uniref:WD40 repeat-like protein n=1 Tax=Coniophora puteana (strain RWD-64-598) TaxID=741705 RepID=A0A5M3MXL3_CONPW|nr:WD40 repeat-like protein [Coniophora puteana RWD-64-598 SS2]EIW83737.1 WD40 repeat-like protein [Coniophora puteana RWD-64-598 SS2]